MSFQLQRITIYKTSIIILSVISVAMAVVIGFNYDLICKNTTLMLNKNKRVQNRPYYENLNDRSYNNLRNFKYQIVDKDGKPLSQNYFDKIGFFDNDIAPASVNSKWGYINKAGKFIIKPKFDSASEFFNSFAKVVVNDKVALIDTKGNYIIPPKYDYLDPTFNNLYMVKKGDKYGYINQEGKVIIPVKFESLGEFFISQNNMEVNTIAKYNSKWGIISKNGNFVLKPQFDSLIQIRPNQYKVGINGLYGVIDNSGKYLLEPKYEEITTSGYLNSSNINVKLNGKWGYVDNNWKLVGTPNLDFPLESRNGVYVKKVISTTPLNVNNHSVNTISKEVKYKLPANSEIHLVSGYEPGKTLTSKIIVNRPGKNIVLVLSSYDKINWDIVAASGTKIVQIVYGGYEDSYIKAPMGTKIIKERLPYAYQADNGNFKRIQKYILENFGKTQINSFTGSYTIPEKVSITKVDSNPKLDIDYPKVDKSKENTLFTLLNVDGKIQTLSPKGPFNNLFYSPDATLTDTSGRYVFKKGDDELIINDTKLRESKAYHIPRTFPSFSWAEGMAYSTKDNFVYIGSFGGDGVLYKFNFKNRRWVNAVTLNGDDCGYMVYDPYNNDIITMEAMGGVIKEMKLDGKVIKHYIHPRNLPGYLDLYDEGNGPGPNLSIIPLKDYLVLVKFKSSDIGSNSNPSEIERVWLFNRKTNAAKLTYKSSIF